MAVRLSGDDCCSRPRSSGRTLALGGVSFTVPSKRLVEDLTDSQSAQLAERYAVEDLAGRGGMAVVYRARDLRHGRTVALKMLLPEASRLFGVERFRREIEIAANLQHPNILPVFDSGEVDGALYYVMPYVDGDSLRAKLKASGTMPLDVAIPIIREVADALGWAHKQGVVHRDIKPENILFSAGHALLADFGIARALDETRNEAEGLTRPGFGLGTPEYMSPEQAFGEPVDGRTDLYAMACVFYEMVTGLPPFYGMPATAMLLQKTTRDAARPKARPPLPGNVEAALMRALARDVDTRLASVDAFLAALGDTALPGTSRHSVLKKPDPAIAVLPFVNTGGNVEDNYFGEGLTGELIHALGGTKGLRVIGRLTSLALRDRAPADIGKELDVDVVLHGSVRRGGDRLRIMAHLVDAQSGYEKWSGRYDRQVTDVFAIQDEITRAIVESLRAELLATPSVHAMNDIGAYDSYLKARYHWHRRSASGMQRSIEYLHEALKNDPLFAAAQAALAETHVTMAIYGAAAPEAAMPAARAAAENALALEPDMGEALSALASVHAFWDWDWAAASRDFRRAIETSPQYPTAHQWYAMHFLVPRGQFPLAFRHLMRAHELEPLSPTIAVSLGLTHLFARDYEAAIDAFQSLIARDPEFAPAHAFLGQALALHGRAELGIAEIAEAIRLGGESPEWIAARGVACALAGDAALAGEAMARLMTLGATQFVSPVLGAQVLAALGETTAALDALEAAVKVRATDLVWIAVRPIFEPLHGMPRFEALPGLLGLR